MLSMGKDLTQTNPPEIAGRKTGHIDIGACLAALLGLIASSFVAFLAIAAIVIGIVVAAIVVAGVVIAISAV